MEILEKMVSGGGRILDTIKSTTEYNMSIVSGTALWARAEITTEGLDNNLITIFKDWILSSKLSNVLEDFRSITVNDDNIEEPHLKKRKRNKCYYTKNITHGFQSSIASNKKIDIVKCI